MSDSIYPEKEYTCCFSGHRDINDSDLEQIRENLKSTIIKLIEKEVYRFVAGGALGFDTIAAETVLELKKEFPHIKLYLALPCKTQTNSWQQRDKEIYEEIKSNCDNFMYVSENYFRGCMQKRNRLMVDISRYLICYLNKNTGGTAYTVSYAKKNGLDIVNLASPVIQEEIIL